MRYVRDGITKISLTEKFPFRIFRAIYHAFVDDDKLLKTYFDTWKNAAVVALIMIVAFAMTRNLSGFEKVIFYVAYGMIVFASILALVAQGTQHFGREFRRKIAYTLFPEYRKNPIQRIGDDRYKWWKFIRVSKGVYIPLSPLTAIEYVLVFMMIYGYWFTLIGAAVLVATDYAKKIGL
jgi:hypothetical protein